MEEEIESEQFKILIPFKQTQYCHTQKCFSSKAYYNSYTKSVFSIYKFLAI